MRARHKKAARPGEVDARRDGGIDWAIAEKCIRYWCRRQRALALVLTKQDRMLANLICRPLTEPEAHAIGDTAFRSTVSIISNRIGIPIDRQKVRLVNYAGAVHELNRYSLSGAARAKAIRRVYSTLQDSARRKGR